jgi:hypothetical protein
MFCRLILKAHDASFFMTCIVWCWFHGPGVANIAHIML